MGVLGLSVAQGRQLYITLILGFSQVTCNANIDDNGNTTGAIQNIRETAVSVTDSTVQYIVIINWCKILYYNDSSIESSHHDQNLFIAYTVYNCITRMIIYFGAEASAHNDGHLTFLQYP